MDVLRGAELCAACLIVTGLFRFDGDDMFKKLNNGGSNV